MSKHHLSRLNFYWDKMLTDIVDAILKMTPFPKSDLGRLLVCHLTWQILPKSVKKPFVSIFLRFNLRLTRLTRKGPVGTLKDMPSQCLQGLSHCRSNMAESCIGRKEDRLYNVFNYCRKYRPAREDTHDTERLAPQRHLVGMELPSNLRLQLHHRF